MIRHRYGQSCNFTKFIIFQYAVMISVYNVFINIIIKLICPIKALVYLMPINQPQVMDNSFQTCYYQLFTDMMTKEPHYVNNTISLTTKKLEMMHSIINKKLSDVKQIGFYNKCWGVKTPVYFFKKKMHL